MPTLLSAADVRALLAAVGAEYQLMVKLLYGGDLGLMELLRLRVNDLDFDAALVVVRGGKADRHRTFLLATSLHGELRVHLAKGREWHETDLA